MIKQAIDFYLQNTNTYWNYLFEHIYLGSISLLFAFLIGFPLGYISHRMSKIKQFSLFFYQGLRVIPSIGILFILIPFIGVGKLPALISLAILGIPSILLNTIVGFEDVPKIMTEAGLSLGMNKKQLFFQIQLPLALPHILNGLKISLIEIFASASLATYIGAGGLGTLIFSGLGLYRYDLILLGSGSIALIIFISMLCFDLLIKHINNTLRKV